MVDLNQIYQFIDLGGVFCLAVFMAYCWFYKLTAINETLIKILTLLTVLTKQNTNFNHVDRVLGKDKEIVEKNLNSK